MPLLNLKFPIIIGSEDRSITLDIPIERQQAIVSFPLPYDLSITINNASHLSTKCKEQSFIFVFEFSELDYAKEWILDPIAYVEYKNRNGDPKKIELEMNDFMANYEKIEKRIKKN